MLCKRPRVAWFAQRKAPYCFYSISGVIINRRSITRKSVRRIFRATRDISVATKNLTSCAVQWCLWIFSTLWCLLFFSQIVVLIFFFFFFIVLIYDCLYFKGIYGRVERIHCLRKRKRCHPRGNLQPNMNSLWLSKYAPCLQIYWSKVWLSCYCQQNAILSYFQAQEFSFKTGVFFIPKFSYIYNSSSKHVMDYNVLQPYLLVTSSRNVGFWMLLFSSFFC